jgi:8-oxo-dGTP pyrophosphatase MutT (NUDIX family)
MYKVFFNDRNIFLTDDFVRTFEAKYGLFYKYRDKEDLVELVTFFRKLKKINNLYIFHSDIEELRTIFRSCFTYIEAAGGTVMNDKGQLLVIHRRGKWDLPKGKLDPGETFEQAALREIAEECGIDNLTIVGRLLSTYHSYMQDENMVLKKTLWFEIIHSGNKKPVPQVKEDIDEARWINISDINTVMQDSYGTILDVLKYANLIHL